MMEQDSLLLEKAYIFQDHLEWESMVQTLDRSTLSTSYATDIQLLRLKAYFMAGLYDKTIQQGQFLLFSIKDTMQLSSIRYWMIHSYIEKGAFDLAMNSLREWEELNSISISENITIPRLKSEKKAEWLSILLPGTGLAYAGKWFEGGLSSLLVLGTIAFTGYQLYTDYYVSILFGAGLFYAFYTGGMRYTMDEVNSKNQEIKRNFSNQINCLIKKELPNGSSF